MDVVVLVVVVVLVAVVVVVALVDVLVAFIFVVVLVVVLGVAFVVVVLVVVLVAVAALVVNALLCCYLWLQSGRAAWLKSLGGAASMLARLRAILRRVLEVVLRWLEEPALAAVSSSGASDDGWTILDEVENAPPAAPRAADAAGGKPTPEPRPAPSHRAPPPEQRPGGRAGRATNGSEHAYSVWRFLGASRALRGVHSGGLRGWRAITAVILGGRYRSGTDRLRRADCFAGAIALYEAEAARHRAPSPTPLFSW